MAMYCRTSSVVTVCRKSFRRFRILAGNSPYPLAFARPLRCRKLRLVSTIECWHGNFVAARNVASVLRPRSMLALAACTASGTSTGTLMDQRPRESSQNEPQPILALSGRGRGSQRRLIGHDNSPASA
jgi:hypothetical protein